MVVFIMYGSGVLGPFVDVNSERMSNLEWRHV